MATKVKNPHPVPPNPEPRLFTVKQAASYLSTTIWAVRNLAWDKKIPYVRLGARLLFDKPDLDNWIKSNKTKVAA
ncbi:MAG TPA: helix-turn-helix domain-containing protein [Candidatus Acidoferrales bacterium]|nr:helix-turn-helix domain-containing protein [Candidatus Acidoferrales bacterium]